MATLTNPFAAVARFAKTADVPEMSPLQQGIAGGFKSDLGQAAMWSVGLGAGARGLMGLLSLADRATGSRKTRYPAAVTTSVPYPVVKEEDEEDQPTIKAAEGTPWWYFPQGVSSRKNLTLYGPAMTAVGLGGAYGGWKGIDYLLDKNRQNEQDTATEDAKADFEKALLSSYPAPRAAPKIAADEQTKSAAEAVGDWLDGLFDAAMSKSAVNWDDVLGGVSSKYLGWFAAPTALTAAAFAYNRAAKGNRRAVLDKAMKQRERQHYLSRPSEIFAVPRPVPVSGQEEEEPAAPGLA